MPSTHFRQRLTQECSPVDLLCVSYNFEFLPGVHLPTENLIFLSGSDVPHLGFFEFCRAEVVVPL